MKSEFDAGNTIRSWIQVFDRKIKETVSPMYFIKVAAHPSFKWLIL